MAAPLTFASRALKVATLHEKERAIGPPFVELLGIARCIVAPVDTDRFGAFSGEVPRELEPRAAAEAKARAALAQFGGDLAIASEGSFVPYPPAPLLTLDEEWLVLVDVQSGRVHSHRYATLDAVFAGRRCTSMAALSSFVAEQPFPEHSFVLRPRERWSVGEPVFKGVVDPSAMRAHAETLLADYGELWIETDLRAHHNPTRMRAIAAAAQEFAVELATSCPSCVAAHFRVVRTVAGLPCAACGEPTELVRARVRGCDVCGEQRELPRADGRLEADPDSCGACNP